MRDFDMHGQHHHQRFGRHRMAKPLIIGVALIAVLGLVVMSLWNALLPAILGRACLAWGTPGGGCMNAG